MDAYAHKWNTAKPGSASVPQAQQTLLIHFKLINECCLAIRVVGDVQRHTTATESVVLEVCFGVRVLWITSLFPEQIMLANQGFTVYTIQVAMVLGVRKIRFQS